MICVDECGVSLLSTLVSPFLYESIVCVLINTACKSIILPFLLLLQSNSIAVFLQYCFPWKAWDEQKGGSNLNYFSMFYGALDHEKNFNQTPHFRDFCSEFTSW